MKPQQYSKEGHHFVILNFYIISPENLTFLSYDSISPDERYDDGHTKNKE